GDQAGVRSPLRGAPTVPRSRRRADPSLPSNPAWRASRCWVDLTPRFSTHLGGARIDDPAAMANFSSRAIEATSTTVRAPLNRHSAGADDERRVRTSKAVKRKRALSSPKPRLVPVIAFGYHRRP